MEIKFVDLQLVTLRNQPMVLLTEEGGKRRVSISFNTISAYLLACEMYKPERLTTIFGFELECLDALESSIEKIVIDGVSQDNVYEASVYIKDHRANKVYALKRHITQALSLATAAKCPIFIDGKVFKDLEERDEKIFTENEKTKKFLDKLNPGKKKKKKD